MKLPGSHQVTQPYLFILKNSCTILRLLVRIPAYQLFLLILPFLARFLVTTFLLFFWVLKEILLLLWSLSSDLKLLGRCSILLNLITLHIVVSREYGIVGISRFSIGFTP
jgi:hypothetical protein